MVFLVAWVPSTEQLRNKQISILPKLHQDGRSRTPETVLEPPVNIPEVPHASGTGSLSPLSLHSPAIIQLIEEYGQNGLPMRDMCIRAYLYDRMWADG